MGRDGPLFDLRVTLAEPRQDPLFGKHLSLFDAQLRDHVSHEQTHRFFIDRHRCSPSGTYRLRHQPRIAIRTSTEGNLCLSCDPEFTIRDHDTIQHTPPTCGCALDGNELLNQRATNLLPIPTRLWGFVLAHGLAFNDLTLQDRGAVCRGGGNAQVSDEAFCDDAIYARLISLHHVQG
jgi:hypothetical protein